jgi:hypothetical protein
MGPSLGEMLAKQVLDDGPADPFFGLARLGGARAG